MPIVNRAGGLRVLVVMTPVSQKTAPSDVEKLLAVALRFAMLASCALAMVKAFGGGPPRPPPSGRLRSLWMPTLCCVLFADFTGSLVGAAQCCRCLVHSSKALHRNDRGREMLRSTPHRNAPLPRGVLLCHHSPRMMVEWGAALPWAALFFPNMLEVTHGVPL